MAEDCNDPVNVHQLLSEIRRLKGEVEKSSRLLGKDLTRKMIEALEEKEKDIVENLMWFA